MKVATNHQRVPTVDFEWHDKQNKPRGYECFALLFQQVQRYHNAISSNPQLEKSNKQTNHSNDDPAEIALNIRSSLEQMSNDCVLEQHQKADCLEQAIRIIKKMHEVNSRYPKTRKSEKTAASAQIQILIVQRLSNVIIKTVVPQRMTSKKLIEISKLVIQQLMGCEAPLSKQHPNDKKKKTGRKQRRNNFDELQYSLLSGKRIELSWYLIFQFLQLNMQLQTEKTPKHSSEFSLSQYLQQHVNRLIRQFITQLLLQEYVEYNLTHSLLKTLIKHINQIELPILPFLLDVYHDILLQKFSLAYDLLQSNPSDRACDRHIFSLENVILLTELIPAVASNSITYEAAQELVTCVGICSYCGVKKSNQRELLLYQKITIRTQEEQSIVIRVCEPCCSQLAIQPSDNPNLLIFAPLIMSRYCKDLPDSPICLSLQKLLLYHENVTDKKKVPRQKAQIQLFQKIAMNSADESSLTNLIEQTYNHYILQHSKLSLKKIIRSSIELLTVFSNDTNDKLREKMIRFVSHSPHITDFLLRYQPINSADQDEFTKLRTKFFLSVEFRLRDSVASVRMASLELLLHLNGKTRLQSLRNQQFLCFILEQRMLFFEEENLMLKSLQLLDKFILETAKTALSAGQNDILISVRVLLQTLTFCIDCLNQYSQPDSQPKHSLKDKLYKIIKKTLNMVQTISQTEYQHEQQSTLLTEFSKYLESDTQLTRIASLYDKTVLKIVKSIKLEQQLLLNVPLVSPDIIKKMIIQIQNSNSNIKSLQTLHQNLTALIDMAYDDTIQFHKHILNPKTNSKPSSRKNMKDITNYLNSSAFIQHILQTNKNNKIHDKDSNQTCTNSIAIPDSIRLQVLTHLLYLNNISQMICRQPQLLNYINLQLKNSKKQSITQDHCTIILNQKITAQLDTLTTLLLDNIRVCNLELIEDRAKFVVDYLMHAGQAQSITLQIQSYQKYGRTFIRDLSCHLQTYSTLSDSNLLEQITKIYQWIIRCLTILTALTTRLEQYLSFNHTLIQLKHNHLNRLTAPSASRKSLSNTRSSLSDLKTQTTVHSSTLFNSSYTLLVQLLQLDPIPSNPIISQLLKKLMSLLSSYWTIHPNVLFTSKPLLDKIADHLEQPFTKHLYTLFLELLPCNSLRILSVIHCTFTKTFHHILDKQSFREDHELIRLAFNVLFHMLKSGMTGLYDFNKYIFYGLLHPSALVNQSVTDILLKIYANEASYKILFMNLPQSLKFLYQVQFAHKAQQLQQIQLTAQQVQNLQILSSMTKLTNKVVLLRDRKQLKLQITFVKKIGQHLSQGPTLLTQRPLYLLFLLTILQTQTTLDYCELTEVIYSLNKIVNHCYLHIEQVRQSLQHSPTQTQHTLHVLLAYRETISALAFLCSYKRVDLQIKNYSQLLETSPNLYVTLKQEIPAQPIQLNMQNTAKIRTIFEDIDLFFDILKGTTHHLTFSRTEPSELQPDSEDSSNITAKTTRAKLTTKPKQNKKANPKIHSLSEQKPKTKKVPALRSSRLLQPHPHQKQPIHYSKQNSQSSH